MWRFAGFLRRVYETKAPQQGAEYRVRHKNGEWRWHASTGSLAMDSDGKPLYYVGVAQDITQRKRAEETLRHRLAMEEAVARVSRMFVSETPDLEEVVHAVGEAAAADRGHIVLWEPETGGRTRVYEWTERRGNTGGGGAAERGSGGFRMVAGPVGRRRGDCGTRPGRLAGECGERTGVRARHGAVVGDGGAGALGEGAGGRVYGL